MHIDKAILDKVNPWLEPVFDHETRSAIEEMMTSNPKELEDSFYKNLEFGTGGMRGVMGVGTNRINKYTLGKSTQGVCDYMKKSFAGKQLSVAIAFDCRHNSKSLARVVADVFSANGIQVYLFSDLRPTPELSFAVRHLKCQAGIVLTASHNPPEYNGYKVYWEDGGQLVPPQDKEIIDVIEALDYSQIKFTPNDSLIKYIDQDVDATFIDSTVKNAGFNTPQKDKDAMSIVFTSLHGTSITVLPDTLKKAGYNNLHIVPEQAVPDGDFPTVKSPNPEEPEALTMALSLAEKLQADLVVGTDPDADRLGVAVRDTNNKMVLLNGNQTMVLMTHFLLEKWRKAGRLNGKQFIGSTIVSTPMLMELATAYGVQCKLGLTGFKWIAKMIKDFPELEFIGGGEESFGFMVGDHVRDKDAIAATLLICEVAAQAKASGSSVYEELEKLYVDFGFYKEALLSLTKKGKEGAQEIKQMMIDQRENPIREIDGQRVVMVEDYQASTARNLLTGEVETIDIPKSDVLIYYTEDGAKIAARPSGTEPKIKFYVSVNAAIDSIADIPAAEKQLDDKVKAIIRDLKIN
ncbi:MAG: phospho-sugar mutase [Chitinophagaceae bacterium]|nr:MAG: phospho-sugar mutase [Chitinophagaceae bacterium]